MAPRVRPWIRTGSRIGPRSHPGKVVSPMRISRKTAGLHRFRVQRKVANAMTAFTLDDWHFAVETSAP
jgi:hypothetical protein